MAAAAESGGPGGAPACLCVLCGLPAAGKSALAAGVLGAAAEQGWRAAVLPYDDLIPEQAFQTRRLEDGSTLQDMHTEWKSHRQAVLQGIEQFLRNQEMPSNSLINTTAWERCFQGLLQPKALKSDGLPLLFLLDDNFYYPSMRYEVFQLARKYSLGFCQVYLECDLEICINRNQSRPQPIPHEKVMELISSAMSNPLSPAEDNAEQKEADRLKCAASVVHQADQACRRLISEAMKTARENQVPSEHMRCLAAQLNEAKATFLHDLRKRFLQEALIQEEDIDVEHVAKRAVDVFDDNKKQILLRFINNHE
ncbi:L-seryl-tRNA(Sec) kinase isoform X2 [Cololabis saira]|uniref:L-seryl-tRNA(Sec) kinase isoform X2 n=1 Tax=Cololabis saira TaxID=129043 RepID=UPI002AD44C97|nr:L-seryl-tRNA(Sec) kinase isoform X2 [Cololabis saira]